MVKESDRTMKKAATVSLYRTIQTGALKEG